MKLKKQSARQMLFAVVSVLCFAVFAIAQTETARIQGTVTDAAGAVVSGATIKVTAIGTGREVTVTSSEDGTFSVLTLQPGRYNVEVTAPNFKTTKQEITLEVAQTAPLNVALEAGSVTETVTVTTDVLQIETETSAISQVVQSRQIVELPLNGRNVLELARLSPGVTQGLPSGFATGAGGNAETYRGGNTGGAALSINGQRTQANNFLQDGVDNNESLVNTINIFPAADAVQEFRVQTSVAQAEFGRGGGGIINSVTRSGTNDVHGSAFLFIRNDNLDARRPFDPVRNEFRRGQFGATVGGPVVIPGFGEGTSVFNSLKDKVFFFFSYDGLRQFLPRGSETKHVPTAAMRNGDFSILLNPALSGNGDVVQLTDPLTGLPFAGNIIPQDRLNQAALNYLRAFPLPNNGTGVYNNWIGNRNEVTKQNVYLFRIDANPTENDQIFARGNWGKYDQTVNSFFENLPAGFGSGNNPTRTKGLVLGWNRSLTTTLFNELRLQGNRMSYGYEPPYQDQAISADLGIVNANRSELLGGGALIGGWSGKIEYTGDYGPYLVPQNTLQLVDSLSWIRGNHTFKFGGTVLHREVQLFRPKFGKGYFQMSGDFGPDLTNTGWDVANLLVGFMKHYWIGFEGGPIATTNWENAAFVQDDWKVSRKLTLNLGLRYELFTNPAEKHGRQANFDLTTGHLVIADDANDSQTENDRNNFSPRVGFAYDLTGSGRSVIRGGYGIFYFLDRGGIDNQLGQNPPFNGGLVYSYQNGYRITFSGQGPLNNNDSRLATQPLPLPQVTFDPAFLNNPVGAQVLAIRPDNKVANVQQFNIQYQHQLTGNTAASVAYVGTRGRNLSLYYNLNGEVYSSDTAIPCPISGRTLGNCYPGVSQVIVRDDNGRSSYDSLQVRLERRYTRGFQYVASYTLSKTKDNGEGAFDNTASGNYIEQWANSRIDYPHVFSFETLYDLPWGRGRTWELPGVLDAIAGGWSLNTIFRAQSGTAFDVRKDNRLVNLNGDPYTDDGDHTPFLDRSAFSVAPSGFGSLERNSLRSPSTYQVNLGLSKNFRFTETAKLQFRAEAFNLLNSIQWGTPNTDINATDPLNGFGTIRGISPYSNRQIQFGLRLEF